MLRLAALTGGSLSMTVGGGGTLSDAAAPQQPVTLSEAAERPSRRVSKVDAERRSVRDEILRLVSRLAARSSLRMTGGVGVTIYTIHPEKRFLFVRMRAAHLEERVGRGQQNRPRQERAQGPMPYTLLAALA